MKPIIKSWFELGVLTICVLLGASLYYAGYRLETYQSPQVRLYNEGLRLFDQAQSDPMKVDAAVLAMDQSLDDYYASEKPTFIDSLIYPARSHEIAALALSKKAVLLLYKNKPQDAVKAFKQSISINSGNVDPDLIALTMPGHEFTREDIARLASQAHVTIHNLEMLFSKKPQLQQAEAQAQGKGNGNDPEPAPGTKPAPGTGKSNNPDAI